MAFNQQFMRNRSKNCHDLSALLVDGKSMSESSRGKEVKSNYNIKIF